MAIIIIPVIIVVGKAVGLGAGVGVGYRAATQAYDWFFSIEHPTPKESASESINLNIAQALNNDKSTEKIASAQAELKGTIKSSIDTSTTQSSTMVKLTTANKELTEKINKLDAMFKQLEAKNEKLEENSEQLKYKLVERTSVMNLLVNKLQKPQIDKTPSFFRGIK